METQWVTLDQELSLTLVYYTELKWGKFGKGIYAALNSWTKGVIEVQPKNRYVESVTKILEVSFLHLGPHRAQDFLNFECLALDCI